MAYRPVSTTDRLCQHCKTVFQAKDKRRMYCSSSCNTLACQARKDKKATKTAQPVVNHKVESGALPLSAKSVATLAVGAGVVAGLNYLANDRPAHAELMSALDDIKAFLAKSAESAKVEEALDYLVRYIDAQRAADSGLDQRMKQSQPRDEPPKKQAAPVSSGLEGLLSKNLKKRRRKKKVSP
ncbi:hypothetical protein LC612_40380 [Nostoc sp. CHAB 5834]|nr:hypothetical protein [Nostoc sp. CHAB 5834]